MFQAIEIEMKEFSVFVWSPMIEGLPDGRGIERKETKIQQK